MSDKACYRILRTHSSLVDLEAKVNAETDYLPVGAPFRDSDSREWCQAMSLKPNAPAAGEINIREPRKK
jgi:predicted component of type VI protein secretion system